MSSLGGGSSRERMNSGGGSSRDKSERDHHSRDRERTVDDTAAASAAGNRERSGSGSLEKVDHHREHRERDRHGSDSRAETSSGNIASTGVSRSESPNDESAGGGGGHHGQSSHHREREPSTSRIERERERGEKRERERGDRESSVSGREKKMKKEKKPRKKRKQASIERSGSANDISQSSHHSGVHGDKKYDHQVAEGVEGGQYSHRDRKEKKGKKRKIMRAQKVVNDMIGRAPEEHHYSALGSAVDTDSSEREDEGQIIVISAVGSSKSDRGHSSGENAKTTSIKQEVDFIPSDHEMKEAVENHEMETVEDNDIDADDDGSIFGQGNSSNNSTWVECDKCKKWRRFMVMLLIIKFLVTISIGKEIEYEFIKILFYLLFILFMPMRGTLDSDAIVVTSLKKMV